MELCDWFLFINKSYSVHPNNLCLLKWSLHMVQKGRSVLQICLFVGQSFSSLPLSSQAHCWHHWSSPIIFLPNIFEPSTLHTLNLTACMLCSLAVLRATQLFLISASHMLLRAPSKPPTSSSVSSNFCLLLPNNNLHYLQTQSLKLVI